MPLVTRRSLFWKYAAYFGGLVSALLVVSGAVGGYFAYREAVAALEEVQGARAHFAATKIEDYMRDVQEALYATIGTSSTPQAQWIPKICASSWHRYSVTIPKSARCIGSPAMVRSASRCRDSVSTTRVSFTATGPMIRLSSGRTMPRSMSGWSTSEKRRNRTFSIAAAHDAARKCSCG